MTRENKLGLIIGFGIVLFFGVLISDHFSPATEARLASLNDDRESIDFVAPTEPIVIVPTSPLAKINNNPVSKAGKHLQNISRDKNHKPLIIDLGSPGGGNHVRDLLDNTQAQLSNRSSGSSESTGYLLHKVRRGDTLYGLSKKYYGTAERRSEILAANLDVLKNADDLQIGMTLKIPGIRQKYTPVPKTRPHSRNEQPLHPLLTYKVKKGDVLSVIAQKLTGTARNTEALFEANKDVIDDPDHLIEGTVIRIPPELALSS